MFDANSTMFKELGSRELDALMQNCKIKEFKKQQYLFDQHSNPEYVYSLDSGAAAIERIAVDGRRQILGFVFHGEYIGITNAQQYDYAVKCLTPVKAHQFQRKTLNTLCEEFPKLDYNLRAVSSNVMDHLLNQLFLLGQKKAHERLCFLFLLLLQRMPGATVSHIELPMTRLDIADYLGLTTETVSRSLTKLKLDGLVKMTGVHSFAITDYDAIQELADIS
jgi:CRP/FNR family transcriptional regulator